MTREIERFVSAPSDNWMTVLWRDYGYGVDKSYRLDDEMRVSAKADEREKRAKVDGEVAAVLSALVRANYSVRVMLREDHNEYHDSWRYTMHLQVGGDAFARRRGRQFVRGFLSALKSQGLTDEFRNGFLLGAHFMETGGRADPQAMALLARPRLQLVKA